MIQTITRNNSDSFGKIKVFAAVLPEDADRFLPVMAGILLDKMNCVLCYEAEGKESSDPEKSDRELTDTLKASKFLALAVTNRLANCQDAKIIAGLRFCEKYNIPVLPLVLENGAEVAFGKNYGGLQCLSSFLEENGGVPYDEKLTDFLNRNIISEEKIEKIRAAFDTAVFISYRKKDRAYIPVLQRAVHATPELRDLAIWYDEFLTIGENFEDNIRSQLDASAACVYLLTPNMLETGNYVIGRELPYVKLTGKPSLAVIPQAVELTDNERLLLSAKFCSASGIFSSEDTKALGESLKALLHTQLEAGKNRRQEPEHLYYMGLAYLDGIMTEKDPAVGIRLLQQSGQGGYTPALEKLIEIYSFGLGAERDPKLVLQLEKQLVGLLGEKQTASGEYFEEKLKLAHRLSTEGRREEALRILEEERGELEACGHFEGKEACRQRVQTEYMAVLLLVGKGSRFEEEAASESRKALKKERPEAEQNPEAELNRLNSLCEQCGLLFDRYKQLARYDAAREQIQKALAYNEQARELLASCIGELNPNPVFQAKRLYPTLLSKLAEIQPPDRELKLYEEQILPNLGNLMAEYQNTKAYINLERDAYVAMITIGDLALARKSYDDAVYYYGEALKWAENYHRAIGDTESLLCLQMAILQYGKAMLYKGGRLLDILTFLGSRSEVFEATADADGTEPLRIRYRYKMLLADIYADLDPASGMGQQMVADAADIASELLILTEGQEPQYTFMAVDAYLIWAEMEEGLHPNQALSLYETALGGISAILEDRPDNGDARAMQKQILEKIRQMKA